MTEARTAIVTGAGKRVGADITRSLLSAGWFVVAHVHHEADDVPAGSTKVVSDLTDPDFAPRVFEAAASPVRLLVNNAARFAWDGFGDFRAGEFDQHMAVNVQAPALLIEELAQRHDGGDALVVNLLDAKIVAPNPDYLSYTLSKNALAALTELAARALAAQKIRVNGIAPALMLRSPGQTDENFRAMHANNPLGRGVEPQDVCTALHYLIEATAVTGQIITIDGGQRFMGLGRDVQFLEP